MSFDSTAGFFAGAFYFRHYDSYLIIAYTLQPAIHIYTYTYILSGVLLLTPITHYLILFARQVILPLRLVTLRKPECPEL